MRQFTLCPKLCFMQVDNDTCTGITEHHCNGACEKKEDATIYNQRVLEAIGSLTQRPSYIVIDKGLSEDEISCIMVLQGSFIGMGYLPKNVTDLSKSTIQEYIKPYKENSFIRMLLDSHAFNNADQIKSIS